MLEHFTIEYEKATQLLESISNLYPSAINGIKFDSIIKVNYSINAYLQVTADIECFISGQYRKFVEVSLSRLTFK